MAINGLHNTKNAVQVKQIRATVEKFINVLNEKPIGLHFSGHGIEKREGDCLVFETNEGCSHFISEEKLKQDLEVTSCKLRFVTIMSCHS